MGFGLATASPLVAAALRNSRNSSPVRVGKKGVEWATISVCLCFSASRIKRIAMPRGSACASKSGMLGIPVELEKRIQMGVEGLLKWRAVESVLASGRGMKVPVKRSPFACARELVRF